jgi:predicted metalloprotease with PDZ domain
MSNNLRAIVAACFAFYGILSTNVAAAADVDRSVIELKVDAHEAPRRLFHAKLTIPAKPGPMTLVYPKWIQGEHGPNGPINDLTGLKITAGDKSIPWRRDDVDLYAFHITVPAEADAIEVSLDYLGPASKEASTYTSLPTTPSLAIVHWYTLLLYPQGQPVRDIKFHAKLTVPDGWKSGTALPIENETGTTTIYQTVSLETLADSPALCGRYFREIPLGTVSGAAHSLVVACDSPQGLNASPEVIDQYKRLVTEAQALFGARHYRSYRFLMTLSDQFPHNAVEHHECSDNRLAERFFLDDKYRKLSSAWVLAHEYVHSWNGKFRRPEGLATPDFQQPMRTELLWVYEGLTEYLGFVLAARSGLYSQELSHDNFGLIADWAKHQEGRNWRPLADTAIAAPFLYGARHDWSSRRRGVDFYNEGALIWLDADTLIREKSDGKKSLDDFCHAFYGGGDGVPEVKPYNLDDIVSALNAVVPFDWKGFLDRRIYQAGTEAPLDGITRGGWRLVYRAEPSELSKARSSDDKSVDLRSSLGIVVGENGEIVDVIPSSPADKAGVGAGMKLLGLDGWRFSSERLNDRVAATKGGEAKITLLLEDGEQFHSAVLEYSGGAQFPVLQKIDGEKDILSEILRAKRPAE